MQKGTDSMGRKPDFNLRDLSVLSYAQGFTFWHLRCDSLDNVESRGYLNPAGDLLKSGDIVMAVNIQNALYTVRVSKDGTVNLFRMAVEVQPHVHEGRVGQEEER